MHALDAEYLLLVQQLNINQRSAESKRVMVRHPECEQAVLFIVPQVKVVPGPPAVRERLQANRAYISLYLPIPPYISPYLEQLVDLGRACCRAIAVQTHLGHRVAAALLTPARHQVVERTR